MNTGATELKATQLWADLVRTEHEQAARLRTDEANPDHWKKLAHRFAPRRRDAAMTDETYVAVSKYISRRDTVLDVGAGAGRLAIPLSDSCEHVTAVEPSEAMQEQIRAQAADWGVNNLTVVGSKWEDAEVEPADVVICAHVIYTVEAVEPFLRKLSAASRRDVLVVVFDDSAMSNYVPLWKPVYGEERISLPSLHELQDVLTEMQIEFSAEPLPEWESRPFTDPESAFQECLARLFMSDTPKNVLLIQNLRRVLETSLEPVAGGLRFKWAKPHRPWLVRWGV